VKGDFAKKKTQHAAKRGDRTRKTGRKVQCFKKEGEYQWGGGGVFTYWTEKKGISIRRSVLTTEEESARAGKTTRNRAARGVDTKRGKSLLVKNYSLLEIRSARGGEETESVALKSF